MKTSHVIFTLGNSRDNGSIEKSEYDAAKTAFAFNDQQMLRMRNSLTIICCTPTQFVDFQILRNSLGSANRFKELSVLLTTEQPNVKHWVDVRTKPQFIFDTCNNTSGGKGTGYCALPSGHGGVHQDQYGYVWGHITSMGGSHPMPGVIDRLVT